MSILVDGAGSTVLWTIVKASVLFGAAALLQALLRRRLSAAARHLVWTIAIASVLLLPVATMAVPEWQIAIRTDSVAVPVAPVVDAPAIPEAALSASTTDRSPLVRTESTATVAAPSPASLTWTSMAGVIYLAVAAILLLRLLAGRWRVNRFADRATPVTDEDWLRLLARCAASVGVARPVRLLRSREQTVPAAVGTLSPAIVIPAIADAWSEDRRRAVLLHELAHVARWDCLTQMVAAAACAVYWFHPAAWWIARRLRVERELACDDRAIAAGAEARDYAGHLLEIAYTLGGHRAPALAVGMARRHQIEGRLLAALDGARNRTSPALRVRAAAGMAALGLLLSIAGARPIAVAAETVEPVETAPALPAAQDTWESLKERAQKVAHHLMRVASQAVGGQDGLPGTWEIRSTETEGTVHLRLSEFRSSHSSNIKLSELTGLTAAQLAGSGPVKFTIRRDAGTLTFDGVARGGVAAGTFSFAPDAAFAGELAKRGFARPTAAEQYQLARHDIGFAFVDELNRQGYAKPATPDLVRAGQHGVGLVYLREMGALGHRFQTLEPLITLRDHGVTPDYIRGLEAEGYKGLDADALRRARDHGISPDYVRGMREAGYGSLPMDALINARDHGVSPEYARQLGDAGYRKLALDDLIRVRDHGVSVEYARGMREQGYTLALEDLVRTRDHGVSTEYVQELTALGYAKLPIESVIRMRDHGVSTEYVRELQRLGYQGLSVDDLVALRDHGVTIARINDANKRAGTRLPLDLLRSMR